MSDWPNNCGARPDDGGDTRHCFHRLGGGDIVCCWCGDLFIEDDSVYGAEHGEYAQARTEVLP